MKKIFTILLVAGLLLTLAGGISADEHENDEEPGNLVRPTTTEGDVFILADPDAPLYPGDNQKGLEEPLIMPAPESCEEGLIIAPYHESPTFDLGANSLLEMVRAYIIVLLQAIFSIPVA